MLVALVMTVALGVSMLASAADTATETVVVTQVIEKGTEPIQSTYTYWLTPEDATYPLPNELKNTTPTSEGKYKVGSITGNSTDKTANNSNYCQYSIHFLLQYFMKPSVRVALTDAPLQDY